MIVSKGLSRTDSASHSALPKASSKNTENKKQYEKAFIIVPNLDAVYDFTDELARFCDVEIVKCCSNAPRRAERGEFSDEDDQGKDPTTQETANIRVSKPEKSMLQDKISQRYLHDDAFVQQQIDTARILVLAAPIAQNMLTRNLFPLPPNDASSPWLYILDGIDAIALASSAFIPRFVSSCSSAMSNHTARLFATSSKSHGCLRTMPHLIPLFDILQTVHSIEVQSADSLKSAKSLPPINLEAYDPGAARISAHQLPCAPRDFLNGVNPKHLDILRLFRKGLVLGNTNAAFDERVCQKRVNNLVTDGEDIYKNLGLWCFYKFVELELLSSLGASNSEASDDINHSKKRRLDSATTDKDEIVETLNITFNSSSQELVNNLCEALDVGDDANVVILTIIKVIAWLSSLSHQVGSDAATPKLRKAARLVRDRIVNSGGNARCWIHINRRRRCRVIADYLTYTLRDINDSPCCCTSGKAIAQISGKLHMSTTQKIFGMLENGKTNVIVSTAISKEAESRQEIRCPPCDLVVIMDDVQSTELFFDVTKRAHLKRGVIKYLTINTAAEMRRLDMLVWKLHDYLKEFGQNDHQIPIKDSVSSKSQRPLTVATVPVPRMPPTERYEIVFPDTKAILNLGNSVSILSDFCDALPGPDTLDCRTEYKIRRHPINSGLTTAQKAYKKKKLQYNHQLDDNIDDCRASAKIMQVEKDDDKEASKTADQFNYSVVLVFPRILNIQKQIVTRRQDSEQEARSIAAYKACEELLRKGLLNRKLKSVLTSRQKGSIHSAHATQVAVQNVTSLKLKHKMQMKNPQRDQTSDLEVQDTYDLPPVSAKELGLVPVRSLTEDQAFETEGYITMHLYGLEPLRFGILASNYLYTGNTNTSWRYDFAMGDIMSKKLTSVTLQKKPEEVKLSKKELQYTLHFHLMTMRLACMSVADAARDIDIDNDDVWKEFAEKNDKGYLVVPTKKRASDQGYEIDWMYIRSIITKPLVRPLWPLPSNQEGPESEWVLVPTTRQSVTYTVQNVCDIALGQYLKPFIDNHVKFYARSDRHKFFEDMPILGRWIGYEDARAAQQQQPLIHGVRTPTIVPLIRHVLQRHKFSDDAESPTNTECNNRLLIPEYTGLLSYSKSRYYEAIGIVPILYEFERKAQVSTLMQRIGMEVDIRLLDDATSKPAYERLEMFGDAFLKLEISWYLYEMRKDIPDEGVLSMFRRDIVRNDTLTNFALRKKLHHFIHIPSKFEQQPFFCWKPSCMGKAPESISASGKWIADVVEAICAAYIVGHGEKGARHFFRWLGIKVLSNDIMYREPYYPDCFPNEILPHNLGENHTSDQSILCSSWETISFPNHPTLSARMQSLEANLRYTFRDKMLLLEAITHSSVPDVEVQIGKEQTIIHKGNYERLEYFGDALIEYIAIAYAYIKHDDWLPNSLTQWKTAMISNSALGKTAVACFGVDECINKVFTCFDESASKNILDIPRRYKQSDTHYQVTTPSERTTPLVLPKYLADVYESLVAAVFLDSGHDLKVVRDVFLNSLLDVVGEEARLYVMRENNLAMDKQGEESSLDDALWTSFTLSDED